MDSQRLKVRESKEHSPLLLVIESNKKIEKYQESLHFFLLSPQTQLRKSFLFAPSLNVHGSGKPSHCES